MKVLLTQEIGKKAEKILSLKADVVITDDVSESGIISVGHDAQAIIIRANAEATRTVIQGCPELKGIIRYGVGVDNIDVAAATERNIIVANTPGAATDSVAEHAILLMLAVYRQLPFVDRQVRKGYWGELRGLEINELKGKTLGVVGMGRIGKRVAEIARAFQMQVIIADPYLKDADININEVEPVALDELLCRSDCITLHMPATETTIGFINKKSLSRMKCGAILINVARGAVVNEPDLIEALKSGHLRGAGLDVSISEPPAVDSELRSLNNIVLTPHVAALTVEGIENMGVQAAESALMILAGRKPPGVINPEVLSGKWRGTNIRP